jgi:phosphate transport system substrate-binding protein
VGDALAPALLEAFAASEGGKDITSESKVLDDSSGGKATQIQVRANMPGKWHPQIFQVKANGSGNAFKALANKTADVGMASRRVTAKEAKDLEPIGDMRSPASEIVLGLDGIAVIVNRNNPVQALTRKQIAGVFGGQISDWAAVGGHPGAIHLYGRNSESGTFDTFVSLLFAGNKKGFANGLQVKENGEAIADAVASDANGVGYVGLPQIGATKALAVSDGAGTTALLPSPFTVATEDYILSRRLYLYVPQSPSPMARRLAAFAQGSDGQAVVKKSHFVEQTGDLEEEAPIPDSALVSYRNVTAGKHRMKTNFRFEPGSENLDTKALADIERAVTSLSAIGKKDVYLLGFADNIGSYAKNKELSEKRADVVALRLKQRGLNVRPEGFSSDMPVADNSTEEGRAKNRRVEVWIP